MINAHVLTDGYLQCKILTHRLTRWPHLPQCRSWPGLDMGLECVGVRELRDRPQPGQRGMARDLNHDPYFDTQATLPTTVPIAHGRHPTHRPRRPAAARGRGRPLALSIPSFMVLPCTSRASMLVLPYPSHSRVSLYCCVVVSHSARLSIPSFFLLPHARASSASTCSCLHTHHTHVVISLFRCISLSRCIVVSLYLVVSLYRCVVVSRGLVLPMYLARS